MQIENQVAAEPTMPPMRMESSGYKQHNLQLLLASLQNGSHNLRAGAALHQSRRLTA